MRLEDFFSFFQYRSTVYLRCWYAKQYIKKFQQLVQKEKYAVIKEELFTNQLSGVDSAALVGTQVRLASTVSVFWQKMLVFGFQPLALGSPKRGHGLLLANVAIAYSINPFLSEG